MNMFTSLLIGAYLISNAVSMIAYGPQIILVFRDPKARKHISVLTWGTWTLGGLTEFFYAIFIAHQSLWAFIAFLHFLACGTVAFLGIYEQYIMNLSLFNKQKTNILEE